jgi:hypothetical protein
MPRSAVAESPGEKLNPEAIREQLESIVQDPAFRSSKRSIQFLRYVVEKTLSGDADQIKERTIGVEVFGRPPSYDTNEDHVVRTAAGELRKRLAIYYGEEKHRSELRMSLVPGSYIPQFKLPELAGPITESDAGIEGANGLAATRVAGTELNEPVLSNVPVKRSRKSWYVASAVVVVALLVGWFGYLWLRPRSAESLFWKPVLDTPGAVLLAVGDVPNGPPSSTTGETKFSLPVIHKASSTTVPFADAVTTARVLGVLQVQGKRVMIRRDEVSSFSDLREGPVVLIGAFNNEWSLRLQRELRYSLALDAERHLIYIKDAKNPSLRTWSWATDKPTGDQGAAGGPALMDYALISRIWNSETGHVVIVIGGLYTYGTETAGEFLSDPQLMQVIAQQMPRNSHSNLQIVLGTTVTDAVAGPPKVLAASTE